MAKESKYGENTKMVSYRIPESKVPEVNKMVKMKLNEYEKNFILNGLSMPMYSEDEYVGELHNLKKSNPTDIDLSKGIMEAVRSQGESYPEKISVKDLEKGVNDMIKKSEIQNQNSKKDIVKNMQAMADAIANGQGVKSELFASNKKPIEEKYDFEYVTSLPDLECQVPIGAKGMAFYDRYDLGRFYVRYEGKYLRFENEKEFNRFAKDNQIK